MATPYSPEEIAALRAQPACRCVGCDTSAPETIANLLATVEAMYNALTFHGLDLVRATKERETSGIDLIHIERLRQIGQEGWSCEHDDKHVHQELAQAGIDYALAAVSGPGLPTRWPWAAQDWKPSADPIRNLVKAGALISAEIDRLLRKKRKKG